MGPQQAERIIRIHFPPGLYDVEAVKRAAYRLSNSLAIEITPSSAGIACALRPLSADADLAGLENQFRNEVLDYDLRLRIAKETEPIRNLILSAAFSKTGLQE